MWSIDGVRVQVQVHREDALGPSSAAFTEKPPL